MKNQKALLLVSLFSAVAFAQKPTEVPKPSEKPIDITNPADIIIYIILPLFVIALFFIWRKKRRK